MKNLKNWLNRNNFNFEVKKSVIGKELIFINIQGIGSENVKKIKSYLKRYKFNFEYRCNYTYIMANKEEIKADTEQEKEEKTKESKNIDILIKDIKESIKEDTYEIILKNGHICLLHSNTAYSTNFNLLEYNVNTELTEEQIEYIEKELDFYIYNYNFNNIDILKNEILKKYNTSAEKENYKTLNIKTSNNLIKIIYNYDIEGKSIFTIISKNKKGEIYKQENKSKKCILSILNLLINESTEEIKNNDLGVEKMNTKKELRPIYNEDIKGHKKYIFEQLEKYKSGDLNFTHKRINNKMIEEYTKYFVYKDNTFMAVKPSESGYPSGYYDHVKQYNYRVDHINKIILFTDSEVGEVQQEEIKEEFYNIDTVDPIEEKKENNNYITLTGEQEKERKYLANLWSTKAPSDKQQGKESFLNLLFEHQEKKKTKEEFKKYINKLYAANKNIKAANAGKKDFNNYLVDILATEDILQKNDIIKNEFFTNSYNYIKSI